MRIDITVNENQLSLDVNPMKRLIDILRDDLELTGTKEGCGSGTCGACLVFLDGNLVNSCLIPAFRLNGSDILTIEGVAQSKIYSDIERGFKEAVSIQCGFCSPGLVMSVRALLMENSEPGDDEIKEALTGNLCRCTGYRAILDGVRKAVNYWRKRKDVKRI